MKSFFSGFLTVGLLAFTAIPASAADIGRLEWGDLVVASDSSDGYQDIKTTSSDDGLTLSITFSALEAKADGGTAEAKAHVAGHFDVSQPSLDRFSVARVTVEGHIIKSSAAVARLALKIGGAEQVIEWPEGTVASEKYKRSVDIALPAGGKLPSPFDVSFEAMARKNGYADAVYVSVGGITIAAVPDPQVAAN
jgi:hypothetical protein